MTPGELKQRTKRFAVDIIRFAGTVPSRAAADVITRQLVKSGTSVGANYRSACRAKSRRDFVSKMSEVVVRLLDEAEQLVRIFVASIDTARGQKRRGG